MTDAPERIWAQVPISTPDTGTYSITAMNNAANVSYVRSDLYEALLAENAKLRKAGDALAWEVQIRIEAHEEFALSRPLTAYRNATGDT